ncbi:protease [Bacteroides sp. AM07-16]|nr:protease [Bacteroides sp. AM07-16]
MNKKHFLFFTLPMSIICALFLSTTHLNAQISEGGLPPSFNDRNTLKSALAPVEIPVDFSVEDLKSVDAWQVSQGAPLRVAKLIDTDLSIDKDGNWTTLTNNEKIWQLRIQAEGAIAIMLYYKDFYIPEGGKLFIYNTDKTQVLGAYTSVTNPPTEKFATEFVAGDDIVLEYVPATNNDEQPRIKIESIGYGYNHLYISQNTSLLKSTTSCMVNINCEEGDAWQNEKKGVCKIIEKIGNYSYLCSGSLINNTKEDLTPYILSAFHCTQSSFGESTSKDEYNQWMFYFGYERTQCSNTSTAYKPNTMSGCTKVASTPLNGGSDGLLLKLNQSIPASYNVYYNGWDRSDTQAQSGVGIHHPEGDYQKISTFKSPAITTTWLDMFNEGYKNAHWEVIFNETANGHGVTAGGSSGSPLFNQKKLIVGTLTGGDSDCDKKPNGSNIYGKLFYHWDKLADSDTTRMDIWLDPIKKGVTQLPGRYATERKAAPANLALSYSNNAVTLKWVAPETTDVITKYAIYRNNTLIDYATKTTYTDKSIEQGSQTYSVSAIYEDEEESSTVSATILITIYKAPTNVTAKETSSNNVLVSWKAPVYQQTIYWGNNSYYISMGFAGTPFYFGQSWDAAELKPFHKKLLTAVKFLPKAGNYSILIFQGEMENKYEQQISNPVYGEINTITLKTPYVINANKNLNIAIYASNYKETEYPAICDPGPAINGKGNLISKDGKSWSYLYNPEGSSSVFDYNFIVNGVVTSEEGELSTRSSQVAAFPEITGYNIYRNNIKLNTTPVQETLYTDKNVKGGNYTYAVSAVYNNEESTLASAENEVTVSINAINNDDVTINPIVFNEQIRINNAQMVELLEIISADGKVVKRIKSPEEVIYTDSFVPGTYFFKFHTNNDVKVIQGIKRK